MILVTGSIRSIGSGIIQKNLSNNNKVRVLSNGSLAGQLSDVQKIDVWDGDILEKKSIANICKSVTKVVHIVSEYSLNDQEQADRLMIDGTINLLCEVKRSKVNQFLVISSQLALGGNENSFSLPYKIVERIVRESSVQFTIIRPSLLYCDNYLSDFSTFIDFFKKYPLIPITVNESYRIRPLFLDNMLDVVMCLLSNGGEKKSYNLSGKDSISVKNFIKLCIKYSCYKHKPVIQVPALFRKYIGYLYEHNSFVKFLNDKNMYNDIDTAEVFRAFGLSQASIENNLEKCISVLRNNNHEKKK